MFEEKVHLDSGGQKQCTVRYRCTATAKPGNLEWLGKQLGNKKLEDWYKVTLNDIYSHGGTGLITPTTKLSIKSHCRPFIQITIGLHGTCHIPRGFWKDVQNRRNFMDWVGKQLGMGH